MKLKKTPSSVLALVTVITLHQSHAGTTWDGGGGANSNINFADNWDANVVNALNGTTAAIFGTGGSVATMNVDAFFTGVTLNRNAAFSLNAGGGNLILRSSNSGSIYNLTVSIAAGGTQTINAPLQIDTTNGDTNKLFVVRNNSTTQTLDINGDVSRSSASTVNFLMRYEGAAGSVTRFDGQISNMTTVQQASGVWAGDLIFGGTKSPGTDISIANTAAGVGAPASTARLFLGETPSDVQTWGNITLNNTMKVVIGGNITAGSISTGGVATGSTTTIVGNSAIASTLSLTGGTVSLATLGGAGTNENNLNLVKTSASSLTLSGANTFSGTTTASQGILLLSHQQAIQYSTLVMNAGTVQFASTVSANAFTVGGLSGTSNLTLQNNAGSPAAIALSVGGNNADTSYSGVLSGSGSLIKNGSGTLTFNGASANTFSGGLTVNSGKLLAGTGHLGALALAKPINLNGGTLSYSGATLSSDTLAITMGGSATLEVTVASNTLRSGGPLTGSGNLDIQGPGIVSFGKNSVATLGSTYSGTLTVKSGGTLDIRNPDSLGATGTSAKTIIETGGTLLINPFGQPLGVAYDAETLEFQGTSTLINRNQSPSAATTNTLQGPVSTAGTLNVYSLSNGGATTLKLNGAISGSGGINFGGSGQDGTYQLTSNLNAYTGATTVKSGTLIVNGSISTSSLTTVESGATLSGTGTVGDLTILSGGSLTPGNSAGILNVGDYDQAGTLNLELNGLTAGSQHDQMNVTGTVNLSGSLSALFGGGYLPVNGALLFILLNDDVDSITGTFSGLAQNATVTNYGGLDWRISYTANSSEATFTGGNDVALMAVPEPASASLGALGLLALFRRRRD